MISNLSRVHFFSFEDLFFFRLFLSLKFRSTTVTISKNELQLTQQCLKLNVMMRFFQLIWKLWFDNHDCFKMISKLSQSITKIHNCLWWSSIIKSIFAACVMSLTKNSLASFNLMNFVSSAMNSLCCLTYLRSTWARAETSKSIRISALIVTCLTITLTIQFICRSLKTMNTSFSEIEINFTVTKRWVFCSMIFSNFRIFLRNAFSFNFRARRCSKTFNFSNRRSRCWINCCQIHWKWARRCKIFRILQASFWLRFRF